MKDALVKAQDYAEAADVKLGQLISFSDRLPERNVAYQRLELCHKTLRSGSR
jgi:uncharacterized protein YggE